jgi:hypothetical protein
MEREGSVPYSQKPATCYYPEPHRSMPPPSNLSTIYFNIILPSTPDLPSLRFPH